MGPAPARSSSLHRRPERPARRRAYSTASCRDTHYPSFTGDSHGLRSPEALRCGTRCGAVVVNQRLVHGRTAAWVCRSEREVLVAWGPPRRGLWQPRWRTPPTFVAVPAPERAECWLHVRGDRLCPSRGNAPNRRGARADRTGDQGRASRRRRATSASSPVVQGVRLSGGRRPGERGAVTRPERGRHSSRCRPRDSHGVDAFTGV